MTRVRLRSSRLPEEESQYYGRVYPEGYKHDRWPDHVERVTASVEMIRRYENRIRTAADLSCGDAAILRGVCTGLKGPHTVYLGDLNGAPDTGPLMGSASVTRLPAGLLPDSLWTLPEGDALPVDLFVLSETLEHMNDPDDLLRQLTMFSTYLFLSTPVDEEEGSGNLEHYWGWGTDDIHAMLMEAGWHPLEKQILVPDSTKSLPGAYHYQLWLAVNR